jgi:hypothetical protein
MANKKVFVDDEGVDEETLTDGVAEGTKRRRIPHLPTGTSFSQSNPSPNGLGISAITIQALRAEEDIPEICEYLCSEGSATCGIPKKQCPIAANGAIDID